MAKIFVRTGIDRLTPSERWSRLISPLADELAQSRLGEILEWEVLKNEALQSAGVNAKEVAFSLVNSGYGLPVVDGIFSSSGLDSTKPETPARWADFHCEDYFQSPFSEHGYWNEPGQNWDILEARQIYEDTELQMLVIGHPGVDGIVWGYRRGQIGIWTWNPIAGEFCWLAPTAEMMIQDWVSGRIAL